MGITYLEGFNTMRNKSIVKNAILNTVLTLSSVIFPLITFPYASRILLPEGMGKVSFATSLISYFTMFAQLGIPTYGIRACAKVRDNKNELSKVAQELLIINLIMSLISYIVLFFAIIFVEKLRNEKILYIIISSTILLSAIGMEWLYKALEQYSYITFRSIIFKFISLFMLFLLVHSESDYVIYGFISIFASSASNVLNLINAHNYVSLSPVGNYDLKRHIRAVAVFFAMACATTIYTNLDTVMLGFMTTDADVGYYQAAVKVKVVLVHIVTSLGAVLLPRSSYYIEHGNIEEFKRITHKAVNFVFVISIPLAIFFIIFARQAILVLSGADYVAAILPMQIIMPTLMFIGLTNILGMQILVPSGREKIVLYSEVIGALTDLVLNMIFIPLFTSAGAAIGTLVAEIVVLLVQFGFMKQEAYEAFIGIKYNKILIALFGSIVGSIWIYYSNIPNLLQLIFSSVLFFGIYYFLLLIMKDTIIVEVHKRIMHRLLRRG